MAPEELEDLTKLQLLQLQSNRIKAMPNIKELDKSKYGNSAFVTDCGVPSAFQEPPECKNCTMCCNANDDCYPTEQKPVAKMGLNYGTFAAVLLTIFIVLCFVAALYFYLFDIAVVGVKMRSAEDDSYALSKIGKDSVYSYIVTEKPLGWLTAFGTLGIQVGILVFFILASEADDLQDDNIDIEFTWKCPRDSEVCDDRANLTKVGWVVFVVLMIAFLAKDFVNGGKLIYHSSKMRHNLESRIRYFIGGTSLFSITLFALYVSTVYNSAIATSNTAMIVNSVVVLFVMEIDEKIFAALNAINDKWTKHAAESEELERQRAQIASQQEQIDEQRRGLRVLRETVERIQGSQVSAATTTASSSDIESVEREGDKDEEEHNMKEFKAAVDTSSRSTSHESMATPESNDDDVDVNAAKGRTTDEMEMEDDKAALPPDVVVLEIEKEQINATQQPSPAAAASSDSECESGTKAEV